MSRQTTKMRVAAIATMAAMLAAAGGAQAHGQKATFSDGAQGWVGPAGIGGATTIDPDVGHPAPALHTQFEDFGITFTNAKPKWLASLKQPGAATIGLRTNTYSIWFFSQEVTRDLAVEIRDHHNPPEGFPFVAVWVPIGTLDSSQKGWREMRVKIPDTQSATLPAGWGGYGAEDPNTGAPMLPPGRTFADVLANADEIAFTTLVPGWFFDMAVFDVAVDNIVVRPARADD